MNAALTFHFAPLIDAPWLYALIAASALAVLASAVFYKRGLVLRTLCAAAFLTVFLNPSVTEEERKPVTDVVALVADRSPSQNFGERTKQTDETLASLEKNLAALDGIETRIVESSAATVEGADETRLFESLDRALEDVPADRRAGVIFITDGQIHDIPQNAAQYKDYGPIHTLLTGSKDDRDRRIVVTESPAYGIVGQTVTIRYRVEDTAPSAHGIEKLATVTAKINNRPPAVETIPTGTEQTLSVTIEHAGQNIVDLEASPLPGEITQSNNRAPLIVNGVRDRLRVLLVSGQPHAGGRTWRNLLTADPGVDLVHFTILREPDKLDATPQNELSLIAFPFRELFEVKLKDFDLIIFDRYGLNRILPDYYFSNIAQYVKEGGALLEASGPSFAGNDSIATTALKDILPAYPTGEIIEKAFTPQITKTGMRHPVTQNLTWNARQQGASGTGAPGGWGPWLRQIGVQPLGGEVLMTGADGKPLLIIDRAGEGRVAQLASDQIWLWSRGYEGGGPQAELLRRLAHWLMKEPELEENALDVRVNGNTILIARRSLKDAPLEALVTNPDGSENRLNLASDGDSGLSARIDDAKPGVYTVSDGTQKRFAIVGNPNAPEFQSIAATGALMGPVATETKGSVRWIEDGRFPDIRLLPPSRRYDGHDFLGLRKNGSHAVTGIRDMPLLPPWVSAFALLVLLVISWWFEGRGHKRK